METGESRRAQRGGAFELIGRYAKQISKNENVRNEGARG